MKVFQMRILSGLFLAVFILVHSPAVARADWKVVSTGQIPTASPLITFVREVVSDGDDSTDVQFVIFNVKQCSLRVIDNPAGDMRLDAAMRANGGLAGVNASFFRVDRTPLGLVISQGKQLHPQEKAPLLSGIITAGPGAFSILRSAEYTRRPGIAEAVQAGPFLVEKGRPVPGLEAKRRASRTAVGTDGKGNGVLLSCGSVTLAQLAAIMASPGIFPGFRIERALNLDGGSSTGLWVDATPKPYYLSEWARVRNYLALVPRAK